MMPDIEVAVLGLLDGAPMHGHETGKFMVVSRMRVRVVRSMK